jgi:NADH-quinone oxidoreductase subunit H
VDWIDFILIVVKFLAVMGIVLTIVPLMVWLDRRASALMQDRLGPNRVNIFGFKVLGIIQNVADVAKFLMKEDFCPANANRIMFHLGPCLVYIPAVIAPIVIPFADSIKLSTRTLSFQVADISTGLLFVFAIASLGVYGFIMSGWASNNKYSLLGAMRSGAQMISYEVTLGLAAVGVLMVFASSDSTASFELNQLIRAQGETLNLFGLPIPKWGIVVQPLGFLLFLAATYAETNRLPFDMPEDEATLVAGYHTEYGGMRFAIFFMSEYMAMVTASCLVVILFFGGWQIPWAPTSVLIEHAALVAKIIIGVTGLGVLLVSAIWWHVIHNKVFNYGISPRVIELSNDLKRLIIYGMVAAGIILIIVSLFYIPSSMPEILRASIAAFAQFGAFMAKLGFFLFLYVWVRWTIPRFRYDQVMRLGWKILLPLALVNIFVTGAVSLALS